MCPKTTVDRAIDCELCGIHIPQAWPRQKYCPPCSNKKSQSRRGQYISNMKLKKSLAREKGIETSLDAAKNIQGVFDELPRLEWLSVIAFPFTYDLSKNGLLSRAKSHGHVYMRQKIKNLRAQMTALIRSTTLSQGRQIFEGKVWIYIYVQKPDARGDAVNVVDFVCDAVKDAIDIDDRWFCIRRLDWEIVKQDPQIYIGVGQEKLTEHQRVCSYCGQILPANQFVKKKADRLGIGRECRECKKIKRRSERKK